MTINFVFRKKESTDTGLCFLNDKNLKDWNDWWFALREECPYSELFWSTFSRIRTEYSVRMRENADQNNSEYRHSFRSATDGYYFDWPSKSMWYDVPWHIVRNFKYFFFSDNTVKWFRSYMSNGKFSLNFENSFSEVSNITCGVPQGYTWYLLFLIYVNNMTIKVKYNLYLRTMVHA